jgi:Rrf2 family protein
MRLSTRARYALRLLLDIARSEKQGQPVRLSEVAERTGISRRYLDQVVMPLKGAGLLHGVKGRRGGYHLARPADQIRLGEIVEAAIGPLSIVDCVMSPETCDRAGECPCRTVYRFISTTLRVGLNEHTLANLMDQAKLGALEKRIQSLEKFL